MFDFELFRAINGLAGKNIILDALGVFFAVHLLAAMLAVAAAVSFYRKKISIFLFALSSGALGFGVSQLIGIINFRPRPFILLEGVRQLVSKSPLSKSFPSDHATLAFALAASLYFSGEKKWGTAMFVLAAAVALGRVFTGIHFPLDIAAGALLGILSAFMVNNTWKKIYGAKK